MHSLVGGHLGVKKTYLKLQSNYYWPKMTRDVRRWIETCLECIMRKGKPNDNIGLAEHLLRTIGYNCFPGYVEAFPIDKQNAENIADLFVRHFC